MFELAVISGKGGTGKTSIVASMAALAEQAVLADCDVDAADLHLILQPEILRREDFSGGGRATIEPALCTACGLCVDLCRFEAIWRDGPANAMAEATCRVDPIACEGCGVCAAFCPAGAARFAPVVNGRWYVSHTRRGPMVHAALGVAEENSGKLVSVIRAEARQIAERDGRDLVLIDGAPGIGCAVIASVTGADLALVVTEPTLSGLHDLERVVDLTAHFGIETLVCINKWDINGDLADEIAARAASRGAPVAGQVRYDLAVTAAMIAGRAVVEAADTGAGADIRALWARVAGTIRRHQNQENPS